MRHLKQLQDIGTTAHRLIMPCGVRWQAAQWVCGTFLSVCLGAAAPRMNVPQVKGSRIIVPPIVILPVTSAHSRKSARVVSAGGASSTGAAFIQQLAEALPAMVRQHAASDWWALHISPVSDTVQARHWAQWQTMKVPPVVYVDDLSAVVSRRAIREIRLWLAAHGEAWRTSTPEVRAHWLLDEQTLRVLSFAFQLMARDDPSLRVTLHRFGARARAAAALTPCVDCANALRAADIAVTSATRLAQHDTVGAMTVLQTVAQFPQTFIAHRAAMQLVHLARARHDTTQWLAGLTLQRLTSGEADSTFWMADQTLKAVYGAYVAAHGAAPDLLPGRLADLPLPQTPLSLDAYLDRQWAALYERGFPVTPAPSANPASSRVVVVEYLTGINCSGCWAEDRAFQPLTRRYDPAHVIPLAYHYHLPIANLVDSLDDRWTAWYPSPYHVEFRGQRTAQIPWSTYVTPSGDTLINVFVSGHALPKDRQHWRVSSGYSLYARAIPVIDHDRLRPPEASLHLHVTSRGNQLTARIDVDSIRGVHQHLVLRLVLVEDTVWMHSGTVRRLYQNVVRATAQSDRLSLGVPLAAGRSSTTTYTFDLAAIGAGIRSMRDPHVVASYYGIPIEDAVRARDEWIAQYADSNDWMVHRARLRVVAFVQDLETSDVLQAAVIKVPSESVAHP